MHRLLRTGDLPSIVMITAAAGFAGGIVLRFKPYVLARFAVWRHAWEYAQEEGYQQTRTMSAVASGGLFGAGPEEAWLKYVGAANTDLVFGVVSEEFGLLLALCAAAAVILLGIYALQAAGAPAPAFTPSPPAPPPPCWCSRPPSTCWVPWTCCP